MDIFFSLATIILGPILVICVFPYFQENLPDNYILPMTLIFIQIVSL